MPSNDNQLVEDELEHPPDSEEDEEYEDEEECEFAEDDDEEIDDKTVSEKQPLYRFSAEEDKWLKHTTIDSAHLPTNPKSFAIATWNIDFSKDFLKKRLTTCLDHLQFQVERLLAEDPPVPTIILIQELDCSLFRTLLQHPFVRQHYDLTNISAAPWRNSYGTVTLAPKSMEVSSTLRTIFKTSRMGRDALFIDFPFPVENTNDVQSDPRVIRVANVHLESLTGHGDVERPRQLATVASHLKETGIYGGIVGGDMNPIGPRDAALPGELGFTDGWTSCHDNKKDENDASTAGTTAKGLPPAPVDRGNAESHTWGYQPRGGFVPCRMDKVLSIGNVEVKKIERFGVGLKVDPSQMQGRTGVWASDHYGLLARVEIS